MKYQDKKGVGHWIFNKLGSTPVYLSTVNPETRVKVATNLLHDYGFFNGAVTYSVDSLKNPRKAKLSYKIDMANPYYLDSVIDSALSPAKFLILSLKFTLGTLLTASLLIKSISGIVLPTSSLLSN